MSRPWRPCNVLICTILWSWIRSWRESSIRMPRICLLLQSYSIFRFLGELEKSCNTLFVSRNKWFNIQIKYNHLLKLNNYMFFLRFWKTHWCYNFYVLTTLFYVKGYKNFITVKVFLKKYIYISSSIFNFNHGSIQYKTLKSGLSVYYYY